MIKGTFYAQWTTPSTPESAVAVAGEIAKATGAELTLLAVNMPMGGQPGEELRSSHGKTRI